MQDCGLIDKTCGFDVVDGAFTAAKCDSEAAEIGFLEFEHAAVQLGSYRFGTQLSW